MEAVCLACKAVSLVIRPWEVQDKCTQVAKLSSNTCSSKVSKISMVVFKAGQRSLKDNKEVGALIEMALMFTE